MKKGTLCLLFFAIAATAQLKEYEVIVARLNADLMQMRSIDSSADNPLQTRIMAQFAKDVNALHPLGFVTRNLAFSLTSALAGRDLSDEKLTPLVNGILVNYAAALACKANSCDLLKSVPFRASIEQTYSALVDLGVTAPDAQRVMRLVYQAASRVGETTGQPVVRPIPPG
jgi:hypothetical protein